MYVCIPVSMNVCVNYELTSIYKYVRMYVCMYTLMNGGYQGTGSIRVFTYVCMYNKKINPINANLKMYYFRSIF